jgi:endonuclease-3
MLVRAKAVRGRARRVRRENAEQAPATSAAVLTVRRHATAERDLSDERRIAAMMDVLRREARTWNAPVFTSAPSAPHDPFHVLVGCLLSLRTKDETTGPATARLFALADSPAALLRLPARRIARAIYPVGFYRTKARTLRRIARILLERHDGRVPATLEELLELPGVGRKTANLVLVHGFGKLGICVDTHVHRITNRWGYVRTRAPGDTEMALRQKLPRRHWRRINELLVALGQTICRPISPRCSICPVSGACARVGVSQSR